MGITPPRNRLPLSQLTFFLKALYLPRQFKLKRDTSVVLLLLIRYSTRKNRITNATGNAISFHHKI
jgi:hypothetical protein